MMSKTYFATVTATFEVEFVDDGHTVLADQAHSEAEDAINGIGEADNVEVDQRSIYSIVHEDEWVYKCIECDNECKRTELAPKEIDSCNYLGCPECKGTSFTVDKGVTYAN